MKSIAPGIFELNNSEMPTEPLICKYTCCIQDVIEHQPEIKGKSTSTAK